MQVVDSCYMIGIIDQWCYLVCCNSLTARHLHKFGIFCGNGAPASHWWLRLGSSGLPQDKASSQTCHYFLIHEAARSLTQGKTCVPRLPLAQTRQPLYEESCGHLDGRSSCAMEHHQRSDGNFIENVAEHLYDISTPSTQGPTDPQQRG